MKEFHDLTTFDHIVLKRIIANAGRGEEVHQLNGHLDLQRSSLCRMAVPLNAAARQSWKGRELLIASAVENFHMADIKHLPLNIDGFAWWLRESFVLVDQLSLGRAP